MSRTKFWELKNNIPAGQVLVLRIQDGSAGKASDIATADGQTSVYILFPGRRSETKVALSDVTGYTYLPLETWEATSDRSGVVAVASNT